MKRVRIVGLWAYSVTLTITSCGGGSASDGAADVTTPQVAPSSAPLETATSPSSTEAAAPVTSVGPSTSAVASTTAADTTAVDTIPVDTTASSIEESTTVVTGSTGSVDSRPIDPEDEALAKAATLQAASFPTPWTVFSEGVAVPVPTTSCSYRPDGATALLTNGASQNGPTMQLGDTGAFVASGGVAFPDETLAMEYIGVINTDVWATCTADQFQRNQRDNGFDLVVEVTSRESDTLQQGGFESYAEFAINTPDGSLQRVVSLSFYRLSRTVITQTIEYGAMSDADFATLQDGAYVALTDAYDRVNALL